ncbi:peptidase C65 Otubain [Colletotrichum musicola]|uniref:ubiquitinyl hydrolase 1 n=1 Tax=Colletotrichum musicola TaxID=2175873 RepID=A0A8H6NTY0_9PEZI|nr:peptidase C65 Otubain [Colletotrichum musicola]
MGLPPAARPPVVTTHGGITAAPLSAGNGLQSSPAVTTCPGASSGLPAASDVPFQHQQHHYHNSPSASSTTTSSSHSHSRSYSNAHTHTHAGRPLTRVSHRHQAGASSTTTASPSFYNFNNSSSNSNTAVAPSTVHSASTRPSTMEPGDPSDLAAQEAAARDYQPQLEGPLVGERITSDAITDEYAKADDVYVAKTINLPQTYSHFRPIQGDGNCGWRAIGFSYFEHLVNNGDQQQLFGEVARITSFNTYLLNIGGYDRMLFEDMVDETIGLLRDVADSISNPHMAMQILVARFNDVDASNAIIYHLRLLASSWLKGNAEAYEPFISGDTGLAGYAAEIERPNREIEHLGIMLLVEVLLKPVNFVLEIAYLDRSAGSQVNTYRFPNEANGQDPASLGPIIYLLYRPDHYDILYKSPPNPAPLNLQVNRATSFSHRQEIASVTQSLHSFANVDYSPLAMLPGFGGPPSGLSSALSSLGSPASTSPLPDAYDPSPQSPWLATPYSDHLQQQQQQQPVSAPRPQPQAPPQSQSAPASGKPSQPVDYQLRFSHQCWHLSNASSAQPSILSGRSGFQEPNFTTAMFKNSHFNKAHYQNPHFHPEEWTPDDDVHERAPSIKKKGRIKSEH